MDYCKYFERLCPRTAAQTSSVDRLGQPRMLLTKT